MWFIPLYDLLFITGSAGYLFKYALRRRLKKDLLQRVLLPDTIKNLARVPDRPVWIHAVSVGEVKTAGQLVARIKEKYPQKKIVLSVVTDQGKVTAGKLYSNQAIIIYLPLDLSFIIKRAVNLINPQVFLVMETEIWPNLYYFLNKRKVPILIFNARISDESYPFYKIARFMIKPVLHRVSFVAAQDKTAARRFKRLGMRADGLKVTGNMKFQSLKPDPEKLKWLNDKWNWLKNSENTVIVAGSTHHPEEGIVTDVYADVLSRFSKAALFICPRHLERIPQIIKIIKSKGFSPVRASQLERPEFQKEGPKVFLIDTMGELMYFYSLADIAFVGGSLCKYGGHNVLEPAYFSKPILVGPFMHNFQQIKEHFLQNNALIEVKDKEDLKKNVIRLIGNREAQIKLGSKACDLITKSKNSVDNNMDILSRFL